MRRGKIFKLKLKNGAITLGITALAVLFAAADAAGGFLVSFPDQRTSLHRALRHMEKYHPKSVKEYLEELKEATGFNLHTTVVRLKQRGLVVKSGNGYKLTALGNRAVSAMKMKAASKLPWDGKWRMATFDIPENRKGDRNWLRNQLKAHDYRQLQKSVFVGKCPLPEDLYREVYSKKLNSYVRLLTIGEMDVDL